MVVGGGIFLVGTTGREGISRQKAIHHRVDKRLGTRVERSRGQCEDEKRNVHRETKREVVSAGISQSFRAKAHDQRDAIPPERPVPSFVSEL